MPDRERTKDEDEALRLEARLGSASGVKTCLEGGACVNSYSLPDRCVENPWASLKNVRGLRGNFWEGPKRYRP